METGRRPHIAARLARLPSAAMAEAPDAVRVSAAAVPAAVLVPLMDRPGAMTVLLTRRTLSLLDHPGQISFPGGRIESGDAGPEAAALREANEETGIAPEHVELAGRLADFETGTGFWVTPVVGFVAAEVHIRPSPDEVAEAFEVPLDFVLDPANAIRETVVLRGARRMFWVLEWQDRRIWGVTAAILMDLAARLRNS